MACLAMSIGRPVSPFNCLAASGLVVLALCPADLFRTGPQLSFLAVGTMIWFGPRWAAWRQTDPLERLIEQTRPWPLRIAGWLFRLALRATIVTTAIWLVAVPLVAARFHVVSPVGIVMTTLLCVPVTTAWTQPARYGIGTG